MTAAKLLTDRIRNIRDVIEAAVFGDGSPGAPLEIQVWTRTGVPERDVRQSVSSILAEEGLLQSTERIYIFELAGSTVDVDRVEPMSVLTTSKAPDSGRTERGGRARIGKIALSTSAASSQAEVSLISGNKESQGMGHGPRTDYSLRVTAATTLEAAQRLIGRLGSFRLKGVSLVGVMDERMVVVIVDTDLGNGARLVGTCLVGESEVYEAAVKASLDAVNRQLAQLL